MRTVKFSLKDYGTQFKNDLWCKESVTGYTYSYTWMTNQLGHFTLGFAPAILFMAFAHSFFGASYWYAFIALIPTFLMILKEISDVNNEKKLFRLTPKIAPLDIKNVLDNAFTATWFTFVGSLVAASTYLSIINGLFYAFAPIATLLVLSIPSFYLALYWIGKKICFQQSNLPFMFRLSYYPLKNVDNSDKIIDFLNGNLDKIIIYGPPRSGKTDLAVAIGTELANLSYKVRYGDLYEFNENKDSERVRVHLARILWSWEEADVWIIDDCYDPNISTNRRIVTVKTDSNLERITVI